MVAGELDIIYEMSCKANERTVCEKKRTYLST